MSNLSVLPKINCLPKLSSIYFRIQFFTFFIKMMDDQQNETKPVRINAGKCDLGCTHIDFNPSWVFINRGGGGEMSI